MDHEAEVCDCLDFTIPRRGREPGEPCKHVYAVGIHRAKRRGQRSYARRLAALEEMYRHEILSEEERCELRERILCTKRGGRS